MSRPIVAQTRIRVNKRGRKLKRHYKCLVFGSPEALRAFLAEMDRQCPAIANASGWSDTLACARYFGKFRTNGTQLGIVAFCKQHIGAGVVAHEMVHAAVYATRPGKSWGWKFPATYDEPLAWTVGDMVAQFYRWYWRNEKKIRSLKP